MSIEKKIGYYFKDPELKKAALTHPSYENSDFELLEFLGDRVLGLAVAEILYSQEDKIKNLAGKFAKIVSADSLAKIVQDWELEEELKHEIAKPFSNKVLADICEALLGAVFKDSDYRTTFNLIKTIWAPLIESTTTLNPKMHLQELSQAKKLGTPEYTLIKSDGPSHSPEYTMEVYIKNMGKSLGTGKSKQEASKNAAISLLSKLVKDA